MADRPAWERRSDETKAAFDAFQKYLDEGSIDAAWRATNQGQTSNAKRAPGQWAIWSSKYEWVARAAAYADMLAEQNRQLWERRRAELQERDWAQADRLRDVAEQGIKDARTFIKRNKPVVVNGETIITLTFNIVDLSKVLTDASKLQRLATDQPTENINNLSGAALDAIIRRALDEVANGSQTSNAPTPAGDEAPSGRGQ